MTPLRIQVAGVLDASEVEMLLEEGVDDIGIPYGPGIATLELDDASLKSLISFFDGRVSFVGIQYARTAREAIDSARYFGFKRVQLHAEIAVDEVRRLKTEAPDLEILKAFSVGRLSEVQMWEALELFSPWVDRFFLDTYDVSTGRLGATGKTHDWEFSARWVARSSVPVILAGGLTPENVAEAVRRVRPAGVDAHTGLEDASGRKDRIKVREFIRAARAGFS